jgi:hypothetical protein
MKPVTSSLVLGMVADLTRSKAALLAENALLRQQLIVLHRQIKRSVYTKTDRLLLVVLARMVRSWKQALVTVQPETLLRWHRVQPLSMVDNSFTPTRLTLLHDLASGIHEASHSSNFLS